MRYRRVWIAVVCVLLVSTAFAQVAKRRPVSQGPRALGLVEIDSNGSGRLVPVLIMVDGKFYDASIYKADPVPMALQPGTVYEAVKSGVPQGLFTVTNPLPQKGWLGLGSWRTNAQIAAEKEKAETLNHAVARVAGVVDRAAMAPRTQSKDNSLRSAWAAERP